MTRASSASELSRLSLLLTSASDIASIWAIEGRPIGWVSAALGVWQSAAVAQFLKYAEQHVIDARGLPSAAVRRRVLLKRAANIGVLASCNGEAHVADARWEIALSRGLEEQACDAAFPAEIVLVSRRSGSAEASGLSMNPAMDASTVSLLVFSSV